MLTLDFSPSGLEAEAARMFKDASAVSPGSGGPCETNPFARGGYLVVLCEVARIDLKIH